MTPTNQAQVNVDVSAIVQEHIRLAVANALGKDPSALINAIVKSALEQKKDSYSRETVLQSAINEMIRAEALNVFKEWLNENRSKLQEALKSRLRTDQTVLDQLCTRLLSATNDAFSIAATVHLKHDQN